MGDDLAPTTDDRQQQPPDAEAIANGLLERARHDRAGAIASANAWLETEAMNLAVLRVVLRQLSPRLKDDDLAARVEQQILRRIEKFPNDVRAVRLLVNQAAKQRDWQRCRKWSLVGLERAPDHPQFLDTLATAERMLSEGPAAIERDQRVLKMQTADFATAVLADPTASLAQRDKAMNVLIAAGELDQAFAACQSLLDECRQSELPRKRKYVPLMEGYHQALTYLAEHAPAAAGQPCLDLTPWDGGPMIRKVPDAIGTVVLFNGSGRSAMFAALLNPLPVNQVFVTDEEKLLFQCGITGLGEDVPQSARALDDLLDTLGPENRLYVGFSAAGFGALLYGVRTRASAVIAVSPPSCGDPNAMSPDERKIDRRSFSVGVHLRSRISQRDADGLIPYSDLSSFYRPGGPAPDTTVIYGCHEPVDAMHAGRLAVHERTRAIAVDDGGHRADLPAISSGALPAAIARIVDQWAKAGKTD